MFIKFCQTLAVAREYELLIIGVPHDASLIKIVSIEKAQSIN